MKILSFIILISSSMLSLAQGFTISPSSTLNEDVDVGFYHTSTIDLIHDGSTQDSLELRWEAVENSIPSTWDYSYCDYITCYTDPLTQTSGVMSKIGPGQMAFFKVTLKADAVGSGTLKIQVYKTGDQANADTLTFNYNSYLGINDLELGKLVKVYPNPSAGDDFTITNILENSSVKVFNALGQTQFSSNTVAGTLKIDISTFKRGVYFVQLTRDGGNYLTRKLIVK